MSSHAAASDLADELQDRERLLVDAADELPSTRSGVSVCKRGPRGRQRVADPASDEVAQLGLHPFRGAHVGGRIRLRADIVARRASMAWVA